MSNLTREQLQFICKHIYSLCGIVIPDDKSYLIDQRLEPILPRIGCKSLQELCVLIQSRPSTSVNEQIIASITTNETFFFRDGHPFEAFASTIMPHLIRVVRERKERPCPRSGPKVRIWSAASSTGQEAYSLAMLIVELVGIAGGAGVSPDDFEIMATDISHEVLSRAVEGEYNDFEISRGLSTSRRDRFFKKQPNGMWCLDSAIRRLVTFRNCNVLEPLAWIGSFDCIFCRNLLIYFDNPTKQRIVQQFYQMLAPDGTLFIGSSENLLFLDRKDDYFQTIRSGESILYKKV